MWVGTSLARALGSEPHQTSLMSDLMTPRKERDQDGFDYALECEVVQLVLTTTVINLPLGWEIMTFLLYLNKVIICLDARAIRSQS